MFSAQRVVKAWRLTPGWLAKDFSQWQAASKLVPQVSVAFTPSRGALFKVPLMTHATWEHCASLRTASSIAMWRKMARVCSSVNLSIWNRAFAISRERGDDSYIVGAVGWSSVVCGFCVGRGEERLKDCTSMRAGNFNGH